MEIPFMAHSYAELLRTPATTRPNAPAIIEAARKPRKKGDDTAETFILLRGGAS
jgi:hypothetical protein